MKKLVFLFLSICLIALSACSSSSGDNKESNDDPQPSGESRPAFTNLEQARILLTSQERSLSRVHGFTFVYQGGLFTEIIAPDYISNDWLSKYEFYKDSLEYAANLILLKQNERRFIRENESLYREMVQKTRAMAQMIFIPTYNFTVSSIEELETFHYEFRPVLFVDFLGLKIHTYTYMPENHTHKTSDYNKTASDMCSKLDVLNQFNLEALDIESPGRVKSCDIYPKVKFVASFTEEVSVRQAVENVTNGLLNYYDNLANQTMRLSRVRIDFHSPTGYDIERRNDFERGFLNLDYPSSLIRQALENNLYENLYFKSRVVLAKEYAYGSSPELSEQKELLAHALSALRHRVIDVRLGDSPFNFDLNLGTENLSHIPESASRLQQGSVERRPPFVQDETPPLRQQRPELGSVERTTPAPLSRDTEEERRTEAPARVQPSPREEPEPPAPTPTEATRARPEDEVVDDGDSSTAPINEGPAPIVIPEEVEDFFAD